MSELPGFADKDMVRVSCWKLKLYKTSPELGFAFLFVKVMKYWAVTGHRAALGVLTPSGVSSSEVFRDHETEEGTLE